MIKRTLYFGNPAYLSLQNKQLIVRLSVVEKSETIPDSFKREAQATIPVEDIGLVVLDNKQISITHALIVALLENNVAMINCGENHMPLGLSFLLDGNTIQAERFKTQVNSSVPVQKQIWQQTVIAKIQNQVRVLESHGIDSGPLPKLATQVKSDDTDNKEGTAAVYYWRNLFPAELNFYRKRDGEPPNNLLNYGYAILRAVVARALVASGLLPTLGVHHRNRYNAYALADDIMEPYRPYIDDIVLRVIEREESFEELTPSLKKQLLVIPAEDVVIEGARSPLMVGVQRTTSSLAKCFEGTARKMVYPEFQ